MEGGWKERGGMGKRLKVAKKRGKVWGRDERWAEREGRYGEKIGGATVYTVNRLQSVA